MTIRLLGVLPDPFGAPCPKAIIRFTALTSEGSVLKGTDAEHTTTKKGEYDFPLEQGRYLLEIQYSDELMESGSVLVDEFTPSSLTLVELIRYTTPHTPPLVDPNPTDWSVLFQEVIDNDEWDRQSEQQVRDEDVLVNEDKTIHKDEESYLSKETLTNTTGSSTTVQQTLNYKDATGREAGYNRREISTDLAKAHSSEEVYSDVDNYESKQSSLLEGAESASSQERSVTDTSVTETNKSTLGDQQITSERSLTDSGSEVTEEVAVSGAKVTSRKYIDANALVTALLEQGVVVENVEAFDRLSVSSTGSQRDIQVDRFNVGETLKVDTEQEIVTIAGQLKLTNGDDYKGPVGDSQYLEYAYATTEGKETGDWHIDNPDDPYDLPEGTVWRKHRTVYVKDGETTYSQWSNPYLLTGEDGASGDTLYWKYKYNTVSVISDPEATNPVGWDDELKDGHLYRIERLVSNGVYQGLWSEPAKIAGTDGDNGELVFEEYMYSPYGVSTPATSPEHWHTNFSNGDYFRSSRVIKYAAGTPIPIPDGTEPVMVTNWTTPALITPRKGYEYSDGLSQIVVHMYIRSTTSPALPTNTLTYNFNTLTLSGDTQGWSTEVPEGIGNLWITIATASSNTGSDAIAPNEWTDPQLSSTQAYNQASLSLYKRTSAGTVPDAPSTTLSYDFTTGALTGDLEGWSNGTIPAGTDDLYIATAEVRSQTTTADVLPNYWGVGVLTSTAFRQQTVNIYKRGDNAPPSADVTYNFTDGSITGLSGGWSLTIPSGDQDVFIGVAVASAAGVSDVIHPSDWSVGPLGTSGHQAQVINLYQTAQDVPAKPQSDIVYDFTQGKVTSNVSPWSTTVPQNTQGKIYVTTATANASALADSDIVPKEEWTSPQVIVESGINAVPVTLFRKHSLDSAPEKHTNTLTYSFDNAVLLNQPNNGWSATPMSVDLGEAVWSMVATAQGLATDATDDIAPTEFSAPVIYTATGSEVFTVYQYAEASTGPWYDEFTAERVWRIQATSINGVVSDWSEPVKLTGEDGATGDTIYVEYNYSEDLSNWHPVLVEGDIWRRERIVTNDVADEWSSPARLKGNEQYIEYQYSASLDLGEAGWHTNFSSGDYYRRERTVINGTYGEWSEGVQMVPLKDVDYSDGAGGDTIYEVYQYSVDGVTDWVYDFTDEHIYRRTAVVINGALGPWSEPAKLSGVDGADGDTIYMEYEYSVDGVNWHADMEDGDIWRHEREHTVGVTVPSDPWGNRTRIRGIDGAYYEYLYNEDADNYPTEPEDAFGTWHANFSEGDYYRIERLVQEASTGNWTTPTKLKPKKGEDYSDGIQGPKGEDGVTTYTWIKYADDASGSGMSESPVDKPYMGIAYNKTTDQESNDPNDYAWSKVEGDQGIQGENGYMWVQYSNYPNGMNGTAPNMHQDPVDPSTGRPYLYIGISYNNTSPTEGNDPTAYTWSKYVGDEIYYEYSYSPDQISWDMELDANDVWRRERRVENGQYGDWSDAIRIVGTEGPQGIPGNDGNDGNDGDSLYTWVKYADSDTGSGLSNNPEGKGYIGFAYNKTTPVESNDRNDYVWSLVKGTDGTDGKDGENGSDGAQGIPGPIGPDGKTLYTWIKYSPNANGYPLTEAPDENTKYLGISTNQQEQTESTDPDDYVWSPYTGADGQYYEDEFSVNGDPVDWETWHYPAQSTDKFKRTRLIDSKGEPVVDDTTDSAGWVYTQIAPIKDVDYGDGNSGDTIYEVYQYSVDGVMNWEDDFRDEHVFRRTAVVINGSQSAWSDAARISGKDGLQSNVITLYQVKSEQYSWKAEELIQTDETYLILTGSFVGYDPQDGINGWTLSVPAVLTAGEALYQVRVAALSEAGQLEVPIPADDWAYPVQVSASGISGEDGKHGSGSYILNWEDSYNSGQGYKDLNTGIGGQPTEGDVEYWFRELSTRESQAGDILTIQQKEVESAAPKQWLRDTGAWTEFVLSVDGNAIVNGTLGAEALKSGTTLTDVLYVSNDEDSHEMTLSGSGEWEDVTGTIQKDDDYRIWLGNRDPKKAPFSVTRQGSANVYGHLTATSLELMDNADIPAEMDNERRYETYNIVRDNGEFMVSEETYGDSGHGWTTDPTNLVPAAYAHPTSATSYDYHDCYVETRYFADGAPYMFMNSASENDTPRFYTSNVYNNYNITVDPRSSIVVKFKAKFSKFGNTQAAKPKVKMTFLYDDVNVSDPATWKGREHEWDSGLDWDTYYNFEYTLDLNLEPQSNNPTNPGTLRFEIAPHSQMIIFGVEVLQRVYKPYVPEYTFHEEPIYGVEEGDVLSLGVEYVGSETDLTWGLRSFNSKGQVIWERGHKVSDINTSLWELDIQEDITVDTIGDGGLFLFLTKNSAPFNWGNSLHSTVHVRNFQVVHGDSYKEHYVPVSDPNAYPDQEAGTYPQITGGGWTGPESESGWGVLSNGDAYFNNLTVTNGTLSSGTIIGADIYAGNTYHKIDYNTNNSSDTVYYKKYPNTVPLYASTSFSGRDYGTRTAVGLNGPLTDVYVRPWDVVSCLETRGEVNTRRFRWGKVRAGALSCKVQLPSTYVTSLGVDVYIIDDNGWERGVSGYPVISQGRYYEGTMSLGPMIFDVVINNTGSTYYVEIKNRQCQQFGEIDNDLYNGKFYVKVRAGIDNNKRVDATYDLQYTVDNDTFPG
ncbi:hypothetical protein VPHD292_0012 [Vibrio phage D292]